MLALLVLEDPDLVPAAGVHDRGRDLGSGEERGADLRLVALAAQSKDVAVQRDVLQGIQDGLGGVREMPTPKEWAAAAPTLLASPSPAVRDRAMVLAVTFGDEAAIESMKKSAVNSKADAESRQAARNQIRGITAEHQAWFIAEMLDGRRGMSANLRRQRRG